MYHQQVQTQEEWWPVIQQGVIRHRERTPLIPGILCGLSRAAKQFCLLLLYEIANERCLELLCGGKIRLPGAQEIKLVIVLSRGEGGDER